MTFDWHAAVARLQPQYRQFSVQDRILLTGHSHQAWPDVALQGQMQAWQDAAAHVDDKWELAFAQAELVRQGFAQRLGDISGDYVLGQNTQELLVRWLSALPLLERPELITTDGEFHSLRRLLARLNETQINVVCVPTEPVATLAERLWQARSSNTAAILCSMVLFKTGQQVPHLNTLSQQCATAQLPLLLDAYHLVNIIPFTFVDTLHNDTFVVGGGYKYCQLGEGNCFLRVPAQCDWRPLVTGWYAEFATLNQSPQGTVAYGTGRWAFEGSTYDPTSHYRAATVWQFFHEQKLDPDTLRAINLDQLTHLREQFANYHWPDSVRLPHEPLEKLGGFLVINTPNAAQWVEQLRTKNIWTDSRGDSLRLGPAPYVSAQQLSQAVEALHRIAS